MPDHDAEPAARPEALDFLLGRRSHPGRMLKGPAPDRSTLDRLLTAALRVPDHGRLEPWRLVVIEGAARARLAALLAERGAALGRDPDKLAGSVAVWADCPVTVAVIAVPRPTDRIPEWEQVLSAGAVCLSLVNAALAQGLGACWLTGFAAYDRPFLARGLGLAEGERLAGFVHIGQSAAAPADRPRPSLDSVISRVAE
jgi:nitroreductase